MLGQKDFGTKNFIKKMYWNKKKSFLKLEFHKFLN
jgi:hypothetical protein